MRPFYRKISFSFVITLLTGLCCLPLLSRAEVNFQAQADRTQIALDESINMVLSIQLDGNTSSEPFEYDAKDFDEVNEFQSTFIESFYENGHFGMRNNRKVTKILRPKKEGTLSISNIRVKVEGKVYTAPSIQVRVVAAGTGSQPSMSSNAGLSMKSPNSIVGQGDGRRPFFVKADVSKTSVVEGEQIIVSYYLYFRVRASSPQVDKFPELSGFLREDLDLPIVGQQLPQEQVMLGNVNYQRALLAKYAVYPLKLGTLKVDTFGVKLIYYGNPQGNNGVGGDDQDPFSQFFNQVVPEARTGFARSEVVEVTVAPLPAEGKPLSFSGGIGSFSISSKLDKQDVKVNEGVNFVVKIQGRGNLGAIEKLDIKWPEGLEQYEVKSKSRLEKDGSGEKVFEFLLIPRSGGKYVLPEVRLDTYDAELKKYQLSRTEPIELRVEGAVQGTVDKEKVIDPTGDKPAADQKPNSTLEDSLNEKLGALKWTESFSESRFDHLLNLGLRKISFVIRLLILVAVMLGFAAVFGFFGLFAGLKVRFQVINGFIQNTRSAFYARLKRQQFLKTKSTGTFFRGKLEAAILSPAIQGSSAGVAVAATELLYSQLKEWWEMQPFGLSNSLETVIGDLRNGVLVGGLKKYEQLHIDMSKERLQLLQDFLSFRDSVCYGLPDLSLADSQKLLERVKEWAEKLDRSL